MKWMIRQVVCAGVLSMLCLGMAASSSFAAEAFYEYDPARSLTGNCDTSSVDPIPDPECPGGDHPASGPFRTPSSIAIDSYGDEYVASWGSNGTQGRIDIFDDEGRYIGELLDPHGPLSIAVDSKGNLYVYEGTGSTEGEAVRYSPTIYEPEAGKIEYEASSRFAFRIGGGGMEGLTVDVATGHVFIGGFFPGEIREYGSAEEENVLLHSITDPRIQGAALFAVDATRRRLFVSSCKKEGIFECEVLVFEIPAAAADPKASFSYPLLKEIDGSTTPAGEFLSLKALLSTAVDEETGHFFIEDLEKTHRIYEFGENYEYLSTIERPFLQDSFVVQMAVGNAGGAANQHYLFVPIVNLSGIHEAFAFGPSTACAPHLESVGVGNVSEREAGLHATVEPCSAETHYVFELEEEGSGEAKVVGEGTIAKETLSAQVTAPLTSLSPGTTYRFSLTATNEKGSEVKEGTFTTYADASFAASCANESLRVGFSSSLPDCRAYELVTPADTNGRPVRGGGYPAGYPFSTPLSSPAGSAITFMTEGGALPGMEGTGSFLGDRYRATRAVAGWFTVSSGPSGAESETPSFNGTSPDQGYGFWTAEGRGSATLGGFPNKTTYLEYPDGHSEMVGIGSLGFDQNAEGVQLTENASHVVFQTKNRPDGSLAQQLEPNAPPEGTAAVYDRSAGGPTRVVSLLPGGVTPQAGEDALFVGASADGAGIAFEIGGTLYLRVRNEETYEIGENLTFAGVSEGGRRVFYVQGGNLLAYDTETEEAVPFTATGNATVVNVAPDGSRAYFVSPTKITGAGENPNGALPKAGKQNLYLSEEGQVRFVAIVTQADVEGEAVEGAGHAYGLGLWTTEAEAGKQAAKDSSRLNPSGTVLLFQSRADLDGSGTGGSPQVYRYDSAGSRLHCVSCVPAGASEGGGANLETFGAVSTATPPFGARVLVPNLAPDGRRAIFESKEALVSTDNDHVQDVYEWEEEGVGSCTRSGGCVYLISSGHSTSDNYLYAMSRSGDDVFFVTSDILVTGDNDTKSIYDARMGGGFPSEAEGACRGEGCRTEVAGPELKQPKSAARKAHRKPCPKGKRKIKRKGKVRCVKKHRHLGHHHRKHGTKKGAAR
jgi:hypothetical protein